MFKSGYKQRLTGWIPLFRCLLTSQEDAHQVGRTSAPTKGACIHLRPVLLPAGNAPMPFPPPHLPKLCLTSPEPHLGPVFPGGQRQRPVAGSQVAFPTQSQSCRHPSPCVPSSQPVWGEGTGQGRAARLHPGLLPILGGTAGGRYLPGSAGRAHPRGSGSGRWRGRRQRRARSRSAAGSRPRGNPGGNLGGRAR